MTQEFARLPEPPYYAVIFASLRRDGGEAGDGYEAAAARMVELARGQPGFLGVESVRAPDGFGLTVSYWTDARSIEAWRAQAEHSAAREAGRTRWYEHFELRVARVERAYGGGRR